MNWKKPATRAGVLLSAPALAHDHGPGSWINQEHLTDPETGQWCCDEKDCSPVPAGGVEERAGGYFIKATGEVFPKARVIWKSPDGGWWRCEQIISDPSGRRPTRCLIAPIPGS